MGLVRSKDYFVELISSQCKNEGLPVSSSMISSVLDKYIECKIESLKQGDSISEEGIGVIIPSWRRLSNSFTDAGFTSKIKTQVDSKLKSKLNEELRTNPDYRKAVGATEL